MNPSLNTPRRCALQHFEKAAARAKPPQLAADQARFCTARASGVSAEPLPVASEVATVLTPERQTPIDARGFPSLPDQVLDETGQFRIVGGQVDDQERHQLVATPARPSC